jgi:hypothetical protein
MEIPIPQTMQVDDVWFDSLCDILKRPTIDKSLDTFHPRFIAMLKRQKPRLDTCGIQPRDESLRTSGRTASRAP